MSKQAHPTVFYGLLREFVSGAETMKANYDLGGDGWWSGVEQIFNALEQFNQLPDADEIPKHVFEPKP